MRSYILLAASLLLVPTMPALAQAPKADAATQFSAAQKDEINDMIQDFLMKNPEVLMKSVTEYQIRMRDEATKKGDEKVKEFSDYLYKNPMSPEIGNPKGDVTIVEFFDYNCGYCKQALPAIKKLVEEDKNVRVVFKELAILGPSSDLAAHWALAANKQGKYWEYHQKLMTASGQKDEATLERLATEVSLNIDQLKKDAASPEIAAAIKKNSEVSAEIGIQGTPAFIINDKVVRGYIEHNVLKTIVAEKRKGQ